MEVLELRMAESLANECEDIAYKKYVDIEELQPGFLTEILLELVKRQNIYHALPTEPSPFEYFLMNQVNNVNLECLLLITEVNLLMGKLHWSFGLNL
jgi:hypothetical protein